MVERQREKMRSIEDLRDYHKDKEIWILGGGESLCDFPRNFFDDKISIALSWVIVGFPKCTYWHGHHESQREYLRDEHPEFLKKCIICNPFPGPFRHGRPSPEKFFGKLISQPIFLHFWDTRPFPGKPAYEEVIKCIIEKTIPRGYRASGNIAHTAIQAAAIMGPKQITLAGVDSQGPHAKCYGMGEYWFDKKGNKAAPITENCIRWQAEIFARYGIEVIRYYNEDCPFDKKGYAKIPFEDVDPDRWGTSSAAQSVEWHSSL